MAIKRIRSSEDRYRMSMCYGNSGETGLLNKKHPQLFFFKKNLIHNLVTYIKDEGN